MAGRRSYGSDNSNIGQDLLNMTQQFGNMYEKTVRFQDEQQEKLAYDDFARKIQQGGLEAVSLNDVGNLYQAKALGRVLTDYGNNQQARAAGMEKRAQANSAYYANTVYPAITAMQKTWQSGDMALFDRQAEAFGNVLPTPYRFKSNGDGTFTEYFRSNDNGGMFVKTGRTIGREEVNRMMRQAVAGTQFVPSGLNGQLVPYNPEWNIFAEKSMMGTDLSNKEELQFPRPLMDAKGKQVGWAIPQNRTGNSDAYNTGTDYKVFDMNGNSVSDRMLKGPELAQMGFSTGANPSRQAAAAGGGKRRAGGGGRAAAPGGAGYQPNTLQREQFIAPNGLKFWAAPDGNGNMLVYETGRAKRHSYTIPVEEYNRMKEQQPEQAQFGQGIYGKQGTQPRQQGGRGGTSPEMALYNQWLAGDKKIMKGSDGILHFVEGADENGKPIAGRALTAAEVESVRKEFMGNVLPRFMGDQQQQEGQQAQGQQQQPGGGVGRMGLKVDEALREQGDGARPENRKLQGAINKGKERKARQVQLEPVEYGGEFGQSDAVDFMARGLGAIGNGLLALPRWAASQNDDEEGYNPYR